MVASGPVTRSTLRQQIADALRDEVLAGRLQPGQEFTVKQIADQYGVSATPVREALVDLSAQGLLDSDQHKGFRVHQFTVADYRGMVEARALIVDGLYRRLTERGMACGIHAPEGVGGGPGAGAPAGPRCPRDGALTSVLRRAEAAARAARAGDLDILIGYDLRFWREMCGLVANRYVADFLHRLRVQAWVFAVPYLRGDRRLCDWLWSGHVELVDAVSEGVPERVMAVIDAYNAHALRWADHLDGAGR
ncbi:GntR family transcriptional regulator [Streptomyces sp. MUM 203J]|uniref:GntR family transcriptional regulator n=1 Tax=Streptomyces sp. MUM 203J TaxID=2791990 RepID=UPI001F033486|nr:GntR family transcriptional regulator [Streptomyces sp. MUM 203J]MCH0539800.1 GntR family transcriptional regulator [Streptomyces sp. MUM 203J]